MWRQYSRRSLLKAGTGVAAAGLTAGAAAQRDAQARLVDTAFKMSAGTSGNLHDIEHVVILMQENHSFDQYFGTYPGVRGFSDPDVRRQSARDGQPVWYQYGWGPGDAKANPEHYLLPFHLDTSNPAGDAACVDDPIHAWGPQHQSWNGGYMNGFVEAHIASDGVAVGPHTMGYYTRADIPFYYSLADAFTLCDNYHCSVMADTTPNRLHIVSGTLDPDGIGGGPITSNPGGVVPFAPATGAPSYTWKTMPDALQEAGVSWKAYQPPGSQLDNTLSYNVLLYFKSFQDLESPMFLNGALPTYPGDFQLDVATDNLPAVSWIMSVAGFDEHPPDPIVFGDLVVTQQILTTLLANPAVWEKTVVFVTYDENGGFFDHVAPPTSWPGTTGEWLTAKPTVGGNTGDDGKPLLGPVGLGFRVPMLVLSPFSAGGYVCSDVLDHTSVLRFIETRFGVPVPNVSSWRRSVTGDMTGALNLRGGAPGLAASTDELLTNLKTLAATPIVQKTVDTLDEDCVVDIEADELGITNPPAYPVPHVQSMPAQEPGTRPGPSGLA